MTRLTKPSSISELRIRSAVALFSEVVSAMSVSRSGERCASTRRIAQTFWIALNLSGWPGSGGGLLRLVRAVAVVEAFMP